MAYNLDLTASLAVNYVESSHVRPDEGVWMLVLEGGAFYTKDLVVRNSFDGRELEPLTQYRALETVSDAVMESKKEVCSVIVITDSRVQQVSIKRRVVGGRYQTIGSDLTTIVDQAKINALDSTSWGHIVGRPYQLPSEAHTHYDKEIYGMETAVYLLDQIKTSITSGDKNLFGMFYQYIDRQFTGLNQTLTETFTRLEAEVEKSRQASTFQPNEIVFFTDDVHPRDRYGYGLWERLPDGLLMMTADNTKLGTRKKIGEGPDYFGTYYAGWRFISSTIDMYNLPSMRFITVGAATVTSGSAIKVRDRITGTLTDSVNAGGVYTVTISTAGTYEIYMENMLLPLAGVVFKGGVSEVSSWHTAGYTPFNFAEFGISTVVFNTATLRIVPNNLHLSINNTHAMFKGASLFNGVINDWDVSNVTDMSNMFEGAASFNTTLANWNVSSVTNFSNFMKSAQAFNHDISNWSVSNVTNMDHMFDGAVALNQDLSWWCVENVPTAPVDFAKGNTLLTVSKQPVWGTCPIPASQVNFELAGLPTSVYEVSSYQLSVTESHPDLNISTVTWTSSNPTVMTVSSTGLLKTLIPGTSTITAVINGRYTLTKNVRVNSVIGTVNGPTTLVRSRPSVFSLVTDPVDYQVTSLVWSIEPSANATIDQATGTVQVFVANQTVTVTATVNQTLKFTKTLFVEEDVANMSITTSKRGFNAYDYFVTTMGRNPKVGEAITFTVENGVELIGIDGKTDGIMFDGRFNGVGSIKLINYGSIIGLGASATTDRGVGNRGFDAIVNVGSTMVTVDNYYEIAGGGGSGGAGRTDQQWGYPGGGGAPYGKGYSGDSAQTGSTSADRNYPGQGGYEIYWNGTDNVVSDVMLGGVGGYVGSQGGRGSSGNVGGLPGSIAVGNVTITNKGSGWTKGSPQS